MEQNVVFQYSMSFKQQVVEELESGRFSSITEAREHYGIRGASTIRNWLIRYGRNHLCAKVIRVEKPDEKERVLELKKQIRQLKEALGQTQAENVLNQEFLKIACEQMGQDIDSFKKKAGMKLFTRPDKTQKQG
jgi:transposase-like protein